MDYEYDLISGNLHDIHYQQGAPDAWHHHYEYDADNRIVSAFTSKYPDAKWQGNKNQVWDQDAKYFYYYHGPLARTEIGDLQVQGEDYAYTIQSWMKGVNSNTLKAANDMGKDGLPLNTNPNKNFAQDAFGFSLSYFHGDYKPIDDNNWKNISKRFEANINNSNLAAASNELFNGNINLMITTIMPPVWSNTGLSYTPKPQGTAYKYDQLNRLTEMQAFQNIDMAANLWKSNAPVYKNLYHNKFTYDANGNILKQERNDQSGNAIENMTYRYAKDASARCIQNRLYHINEDSKIKSTSYTDDIDDQGIFVSSLSDINIKNNYTYDELGNLTSDRQEGIANIKWSLSGKILEINRKSGDKGKNLKFDYDALGNRVAKHVFSSNNQWEKSEYYFRDATGNIMSLYKHEADPTKQLMSFAQTERPIYGSKRLGTEQTRVELISPLPVSTDRYERSLGLKRYEGSNHLGNVLAVYTDKKYPISTDNVSISHYLPDLISSTDYYPFGVEMKGRSFASNLSRFGFNGKEKDDEVKGVSGGSYDYGARMYDSRVGRWLAQDPLAIKYSYASPYNYTLNNPLNAIDPDGKDVFLLIWATAKGEIGHAAIAVSNYCDIESIEIKNGKEISKFIKNGDDTYSYYDLWPGGAGAGKENFDKDIPGIYQRFLIKEWNEIYNNDPSKGEGRSPEGIIRIETTYEQDQNVNMVLSERLKMALPYNGLTNNCSDNAVFGIEAIGFCINAEELIKKETTATTPNHLFRTAEKLPNAFVLKNPGSMVENKFIEGAIGGALGKLAQKIMGGKASRKN